MAVRTREEIMEKLKTFIGDDTSDETLSFIEDVSDTLGDNNAQTIEQLRRENQELETTWRKKYRDAFFNGKSDEPEDDFEEQKKPKSFNDLFTFEKG